MIVSDPTDVRGFTVEIDELNITNPGLVTVEFHGLGPLNFLLDAVSVSACSLYYKSNEVFTLKQKNIHCSSMQLGFLVGNIFGGLIFNAVEGPIKEAITNALVEVIPSQYIY